MSGSARRARSSAGEGRASSTGPLAELPGRRSWFTPETLAAYLQVSERLIRKWVAQGRLRSYKIDGCRRFDPADVDSFVAQFCDERSG